MRTDQPRLGNALRLRCPRCGQTPLQAEGSWFKFREGCPVCDYRYDREPGYFWGASWIISYTAASLSAFAVAIPLLVWRPAWDAILIALLAILPVVPVAAIAQPYSRALWMWLDHLLHPLEDAERLAP